MKYEIKENESGVIYIEAEGIGEYRESKFIHPLDVIKESINRYFVKKNGYAVKIVDKEKDEIINLEEYKNLVKPSSYIKS